MRNESSIKQFFRDTFSTGNPIPYILSGQIGLFVLIHIFDLLVDLTIIEFPLYDYALQYLSLPQNIAVFIRQPWTLLTHAFVYVGLFQILFTCLWLYWFGNLFLSFLNTRQFNFLFWSTLLLSAFVYLGFAQIPGLENNVHLNLSTGKNSLAAIIAATTLLIPRYELRLFLFGNVRLRTVSIIYLALEFIFLLQGKGSEVYIIDAYLLFMPCYVGVYHLIYPKVLL